MHDEHGIILIYTSFVPNEREREWKVLCWNVRGLNSDKKWDSMRD